LFLKLIQMYSLKSLHIVKNDFKDLNTKQEHEFADNVVWIDDILFVFQIKDRNSSENENDEKWFDSKILRKAIQQIKATHKYLKSYPHIEIINEKGHKKNIIEAKEDNISSIVVYTPNNSFPENKRHQKFYESKDIGLIHLFHSEDYYWICKYLLTPAEVEEYFYFREELYNSHKKIVNQLPEQYVLTFNLLSSFKYYKSLFLQTSQLWFLRILILIIYLLHCKDEKRSNQIQGECDNRNLVVLNKKNLLTN
jgi:hypothetical protein